METALRGEGLKEESFISPPVRTCKFGPFCGWACPSSFPSLPGVHHGNPSSKQEVQSSSSSIWCRLGAPGDGTAQLLPGWTWALAWLCVLAPLPLPVPRHSPLRASICHLCGCSESQVREAAAHGGAQQMLPGWECISSPDTAVVPKFSDSPGLSQL